VLLREATFPAKIICAVIFKLLASGDGNGFYR
jgi:hypothetical protein